MTRLLCAIALAVIHQVVFAAGFDHDVWDGLLKRHVVMIDHGHASQVDYQGMKDEHELLTRYLASISSVSRSTFDGWPDSYQLAFLINAYNAWTVELILTRYPEIDSIKDLGTWLQSPWKRRFIRLFDATVSLDDIEHDLIRGNPRYSEPRIHFALNCASIGCPALRPEAYRGEHLESQLEDAVQRFLGDRSRNHFDGDVLGISRIFSWYREDFERGWHGYTSLEQFLAAHSHALGLPDADVERLHSGAIKIKFIAYDWRLNRVP